MKIKSNLEFNTSLMARHTATADKENTKVVIGGAQPEYLTIPAGSTIELEDAKWTKFAEAGAKLIEGGHLTMLEAPKLSEAEQEAADVLALAAAQAAVAKLTKPVPSASNPRTVVSKATPGAK